MKKAGFILFILTGIALTTQAQIDSTAKKVENKTSEIASKGKSAIVDEVYKNKIGPQGQTPIYIDHSSKYYYVDKKGKKVYVLKSSLKNKPKELAFILPDITGKAPFGEAMFY
ncbi:MAG TPA: hypothetical protein VNW49_06120 [Puia sp.]|jgi:hypothetical protein|nr:hypothetical protein [Puia sp.]